MTVALTVLLVLWVVAVALLVADRVIARRMDVASEGCPSGLTDAATEGGPASDGHGASTAMED